MRGWRGPTPERPFPSLGWDILAWTYRHLPSPSDETKPLVYTEEQARRIVRWYEVHPVTGEFVHLRLVLEEAKGFGKSPFAGSLAIVEFVGPVCFDGWDARGEPVGVPWGTNGRPTPWFQIAAVSEDQTDNTYGAMYSLLASRNEAVADELGIDLGRTMLRRKDMPAALLEPVTASAGSREGQRLTGAILDETHLWTPTNRGVKLARTLRRNVAKMGGRTVETTNAPVLGERSVAEQSDPDRPDSGVLHYARRPPVEPSPDWDDERLRVTLDQVYGGVPWIDTNRLIREIRDPATPWEDALRFWFNIRTAGAGRAVDPRLWDQRADRKREVPAGTRIGAGFDGSISQDATVLRGCTRDGHRFAIASWERPTGAELQRWFDSHPGKHEWSVDRKEVHQAIAEMFATYDVGLLICDPPKWQTEIAQWQDLYRLPDGTERVEPVYTNNERKFSPMVDRWLTGLREGTGTHDADPLADRHVKAAHLKKVRLADDEADGRTHYVLIKGEDHGRIDAAVADVLAYEAAMTMPERPAPKEILVAWA